MKAETLMNITDVHKNVITVPEHKFIRNILAFDQRVTLNDELCCFNDDYDKLIKQILLLHQ